MTVSPSKKYVAICEKSERAICLIWDISGISANPVVQPKRKKVLTSADYNAKEFISVAFAPSNEKSLLATLVRKIRYYKCFWTKILAIGLHLKLNTDIKMLDIKLNIL